MRLIIGFLLVLITPTFLVAQDGDRIDALVVALEWSLQRWAGPDPEQRQRLVLDRRRTAVGEHQRDRMVEEVAARVGARSGVIESYCTASPRGPGMTRRTEVREGWGVVAADIQEWNGDAAIVTVTVWRGSGYHTGGSVGLLLERTDGGWQVANHLTTSTGACIPGDRCVVIEADESGHPCHVRSHHRLASSSCAQAVAPSDPLVVAIEYALGQRSGDWGRNLVVDTLRTARHSDDRAALVQDVALRLGARLGAIEDHCFLLPVDPAERAPLRRAEVRGASAVIAADVLSHAPDRARVRVTVWRGAGHHTGGTYELELRRDGVGGWEVTRRITTATAGCIPRS